MKLYVASYIILRSLYIRPRAVLYHTPWIYITRVGEFSVYIAQGGKGYTFYECITWRMVRIGKANIPQSLSEAE